MKKPAKIRLLSAIFLVPGLIGSLCYAEPDSITSQSSSNSAQLSSAYSDSSATNTYLQTSLISRVASRSIQPMPGIQVADFALLDPPANVNKNSIFEFAAQFNDKLQQILAFFSFPSSGIKNITNEASSEKITRAEQALKPTNKLVSLSRMNSCNKTNS